MVTPRVRNNVTTPHQSEGFDIYQACIDQLGGKPTTPAEFADLYEKVMSGWDRFTEASDYDVDFVEQMRQADRRSLNVMALDRLREGEPLARVLAARFAAGDGWTDCMHMFGPPEAHIHEVLPDMSAWVEFDRWLKSDPDGQPGVVKYRTLRRYMNLKDQQRPAGRTLQLLVDKFGYQLVGDRMQPITWKKRRVGFK